MIILKHEITDRNSGYSNVEADASLDKHFLKNLALYMSKVFSRLLLAFVCHIC